MQIVSAPIRNIFKEISVFIPLNNMNISEAVAKERNYRRHMILLQSSVM